LCGLMVIKKTVSIYRELDGISRKTFLLEILRSFLVGIIETAGNTFFLLYLERVLFAGVWGKAFIAGGPAIGLLLSPLVVQVVAGFGYLSSRAASMAFLISGISCLVVKWTSDTLLITFFLTIALAAWNTSVPLVTQIYADNYPGRRRGALFSVNTMFRIIGAGMGAYIFGLLLDVDESFFELLITVYGGVFLGAAYLLLKLPSRPVGRKTSNALIDGFRALQFDRVFRFTLMTWMVMGFGNLMIFPLRVEYLANPAYGLRLTELEIALLVSVIPNITRFFCSMFWGVLFDKINFFTLRVLLNVGFVLGMLSFFLSGSWFFLVLGACVYGVSIAGGDVAWNLWVTKFAPEGKSRAYMSVHTFFTGLRGVFAPMVGFQIISKYGFMPLLISSTTLVLSASLLMLLERKKGTDLGCPASS
jgi:MFS family permease